MTRRELFLRRLVHPWNDGLVEIEAIRDVARRQVDNAISAESLPVLASTAASTSAGDTAPSDMPSRRRR